MHYHPSDTEGDTVVGLGGVGWGLVEGRGSNNDTLHQDCRRGQDTQGWLALEPIGLTLEVCMCLCCQGCGGGQGVGNLDGKWLTDLVSSTTYPPVLPTLVFRS